MREQLKKLQKILLKWEINCKSIERSSGAIQWAVLMFIFISLKWWKQYSLKNLFNLFYVEGSILLSMCVNCIDNQLLIDNKTLLLRNLYAYFQDFFYWNVFIPHQCPIGHCSLNNFLRVSCYVPKQSWTCWIFRMNCSRHDKKRV